MKEERVVLFLADLFQMCHKCILDNIHPIHIHSADNSNLSSITLHSFGQEKALDRVNKVQMNFEKHFSAQSESPTMVG